MAQRAITAEDFYRFVWIDDPQIAPDGQRIAYVRKTVDRETNEYTSAIWLAFATGGLDAAYQFTGDGEGPRWSPDGATLAFVSERAGTLPAPEDGEDAAERDKRLGKGKPQIWLMPAHGGEAHQLTFARYGASSPLWSPDGQRVLFTAKTGEKPEVPEHDGKREPRSHRLTRFMYRFNGPGYIYEQRTHLFVIAATGGIASQLTDGDWDDTAAAWSPDGQQIAFNTDRREDRWLLPQAQIWVMNADGTNQHAVTPAGGVDYYSPSWSPDGTQLACLGSETWHGGGHADVFVFSPGAEPRCLTTAHFQTFSDAIGGDMRNDHADETPLWSRDGTHLFVLGNERGAGNIYALTVTDGTLTPVTTGQHHILGYSFDREQNAIALAIADTQQPGDLFIQQRDTGHVSQLTDANAALLAEVRLSMPETFTFTGATDWEIEGWIMKPHDFDPAKNYPLIIEIHGGPNTSYGYTFVHEFQLLASKGYVVVYTNPRGSTSYGREFSQAVRGIWGKEDYDDIMAGLDAVIARGNIDTTRLGVTGGSYGGVMTNWIVSHTNRFRAAVTQRSICNFASFFGTSDIGPWLSKENWEVAPWEDPARYAFHSAITYVNEITTPLLIIHSDEDWRCPVEQAEQLFTALKWLRRDVELLRFERQNHDLSRNGHPRLRIENLNAIAGWFTRYIPLDTAVTHAEADTNLQTHTDGQPLTPAEVEARNLELSGVPSPD